MPIFAIMTEQRNKGIIAYGTQHHRDMLAALAEISGVSGSVLILRLIEDRYREVFEDTPPK